MKKVINIALLLCMTLILASCGDNIRAYSDYKLIGINNDQIYYTKSDESRLIDNAIYVLKDGGYETVYDLEETQHAISIVENNYLISEWIFQSGMIGNYPDSVDFFLVNMDTNEEAEIPSPISFQFNKRTLMTYIKNDGVILIKDIYDYSFAVFNLSSNSIVDEYTFSISEGIANSVFYVNNLLYIENGYYDYAYLYDFENDILLDLYDNKMDILSDYWEEVSYLKYLYQDGDDVYLFNSLSIRNGDRNYDISKSDGNYQLIDKFQVPQRYHVRFFNDVMYVHTHRSYDGIFTVLTYNFDFELIESIDIEESCMIVDIIDENMVRCLNFEDRGALLYNRFTSRQIYLIDSGNLLFDTGWIKSSSQAKQINYEIHN